MVVQQPPARMPRAAVAGIGAAVLAALVWVVHGSFAERRWSCEVCMSFAGGEKCRTASGDDRAATVRLATDNACAFLASGRAELIRCSRTPPTSVNCRETSD